jgi:predicted transcriptional regulator of viral defense system
MPNATDQARKIFQQQGGLLYTSQAIHLGIAPRTLYAMRDAGDVEQVSRGLYRLASLPPLSQPDLVTVALRIPRGVICLISALAYHDLTSQVPHAIYVALPIAAEKPRLTYPPLRLFWLSEHAYAAGIEQHELDGTPVKIYSPEKSVVDCFKFRNKVGMEVALEALKRGLDSKRCRLPQLLHFAKLCRVEGVMRPYLEALQ